MTNYKLVDGKVVIKNNQEIIINEPNNPKWNEYKTWLNTNIPLPADPPPLLDIPYVQRIDVPTLKTKVGHVWIRNLNDIQTNVTTKTQLIVDGLETTGTFNSTGYLPWDKTNSKITPINKNQIFLIRINYVATPQISGVLINTSIDVVGGLSGNTVFTSERFIRKLGAYKISELTNLFVTDPLLANGAVINVESTEPIAITKANIYINVVELV